MGAHASRLALAVGAVAAAGTVKHLLGLSEDGRAPFALFYAAILLSAGYGRLWAGLLATLLAGVVADYFFLSPVGSLLGPDSAQNARLAVFLAEGAFLSLGAEALHHIRQGRVGGQADLDHAQAALHDAQRRSTAILESITEAFYALDRDWRFTYVNAQAEKLLGRPRGDLLGKRLWDEYPAAWGTRLDQEYHRAMAEGVPVSVDFYYGPAAAWFDVRAYPSPDGLTVYFHDVTAARRAQEDARRAEHNARFLASASAALAQVEDSRRTLRKVARLAVPLFADWCTVDLLGGDGRLERAVVTHVDPDKVRLAHELPERWPAGLPAPAGTDEVLRTGRPEWRTDVPRPDRSGEAEHVRLLHELGFASYMSLPLRSRDAVLGVVTFATGQSARRYDATDLRLAEDLIQRTSIALENARLYAALASQHRRLESILDLAPIPILLIEPGTARVTFANRAADAMAGGTFPRAGGADEYGALYHCTDAAGRRIPDRDHPGVRVARGERLEAVQLDWHTPAGKRALLLYADTVPTAADLPATCMLVFYDITALKAVEAELRASDRIKDEFLATLSHELRTPLNAIVGWSHILREFVAGNDTARKAVETIHRNAQVQAQLISDILDVSRIVAGKLRLDVQPVDLAAVVEAALDTVKPAAAGKEVRLEAFLEPEAGRLSADPARLQQVIWNLVANAIRFAPAREGRVVVRLEAIGSQARITVEDNGPGIEPRFLPHVFDRFRQADSSSSRRHQGLGLGLAIVRHLVELHGGTVHAANREDGTGARFTVELPRRAVATAEAEMGAIGRHMQAEEPVWLDSAPSLEGLRVLVLDDEPDARDALRAALERCGATVSTVASAGEGLAALLEGRPDVVVSDIEMPGEDGYEFMRKVRLLPADQGGRTPAAALTAYASAQDRLKVLKAGFQIHVPKPVQPAELAAVVASIAKGAGNPGHGD
jgi:signal transduction histidine kinase/CheY-like chemotaxis protein